jgi:hypothetical protein
MSVRVQYLPLAKRNLLIITERFLFLRVNWLLIRGKIALCFQGVLQRPLFPFGVEDLVHIFFVLNIPFLNKRRIYCSLYPLISAADLTVKYLPDISNFGYLIENPILTSFEDFWELLYLALLLKSQHCQELLYFLTMWFGMGPRQWMVLVSNRFYFVKSSCQTSWFSKLFLVQFWCNRGAIRVERMEIMLLMDRLLSTL